MSVSAATRRLRRVRACAALEREIEHARAACERERAENDVRMVYVRRGKSPPTPFTSAALMRFYGLVSDRLDDLLNARSAVDELADLVRAS